MTHFPPDMRSWAEQLAPIADVPSAAHKIATVLRTIPEPTQR